MKVFALPKEVPAPEPDYRNYDRDAEARKIDEHKAKLKEHMRKLGYTGKRTGSVVRYPVADGYAEYMLAEGRKSVLIHLPYYDGYHYRHIEYVPKAEILAEIEREKKIAALFAKK